MSYKAGEAKCGIVADFDEEAGDWDTRPPSHDSATGQRISIRPFRDILTTDCS